MVREIAAPDLAAWLVDGQQEPPLLLDVREDWEYQLAHIKGSLHIPMNLIPLRLSELPDDRPIVTICHHGVRSYQVGLYLANAGFDDVISLRGGVEEWASVVDTGMAHY
ncbi:rhodanese-like domain-containing protein [uncultured Aquitalea sp.]|uniref:rhodanese-like domain-containing protein n=1 Tax=uncultured Aquitalea sp. TaxID=540272 RepID=UPI0025FB8303|nr:rhodanese-like domain-containing protein [uncultured Aquitalea sp.]